MTQKIRTIHGDSLIELKKIKSGTIDMVFTDPPYGISKPSKINRHTNNATGYRGRDVSFDFGAYDNFETLEDYIAFSKKWVLECFRVLKKGGHFVCWFDLMKMTYLWEWSRENNMIPRQVLFWIKTNPFPSARKNATFQSAVEGMFWSTKETKSLEFMTMNWQLGQSKNYVMSAVPGGKERRRWPCTTMKPKKVCSHFISYLTKPEDIVLDPFSGSGTIAVCAKELGRRALAIEKDLRMFQATNERLIEVDRQEADHE